MFAALKRSWFELAPNVRGAIWQILAGICMTSMVAVVKVLGDTLPAIEILFFRGVIGLLLMVPYLIISGPRSIATGNPKMHVIRSLTSIGAMFSLFYAVTHMPLAEATALLFSSPLFATILAYFILREMVGWRRALATCCGFAGILIMMRPGAQALDPVAFIALLSALLTAATGIIVKKLSGADRPIVIVFWFTLGGTLLTAIPAYLNWQEPTWRELWLLAVVGTLGLVGQLVYTRAFSIAEPSAVAPFDYLRLILAAAIGYLFFGELPDGMNALGALVIVLSTFYIIRREARAARRKEG